MKSIRFVLFFSAFFLLCSCSSSDKDSLNPDEKELRKQFIEFENGKIESYCFQSGYDLNFDGKISLWEASQVSFMDLLFAEGKEVSLKDLGYFTKLSSLRIRNGSIKHFSLPDNVNLTSLHIAGNNTETIDISHNINLTEFSCIRNKIKTLDISKNTKLTLLECGYTDLEKLVISNQNTSLKYLYLAFNALAELNVLNLDNLEHLECRGNKIGKLSVKSSKSLLRINCQDNVISEITISGCPLLETLLCDNNRIASLNLKGMNALSLLSFKNNQIALIDVSECNQHMKMVAHPQENALIKIIKKWNQLLEFYSDVEYVYDSYNKLDYDKLGIEIENIE